MPRRSAGAARTASTSRPRTLSRAPSSRRALAPPHTLSTTPRRLPSARADPSSLVRLTSRSSISARTAAGAAAERISRQRRAAARRGSRLIAVLFGLGLLLLAAAGIGAVTTLGGNGAIATLTSSLTVTAQFPGATHRKGVAGAPWLFPGGPALQLPVTVRNPSDVSFRVGDLLADPQAFPVGCPLSAWAVDAPDLLPTLEGGTSSTVTVDVSLRSTAPPTCAGTTVRFALTVDATPT